MPLSVWHFFPSTTLTNTKPNHIQSGRTTYLLPGCISLVLLVPTPVVFELFIGFHVVFSSNEILSENSMYTLEKLKILVLSGVGAEGCLLPILHPSPFSAIMSIHHWNLEGSKKHNFNTIFLEDRAHDLNFPGHLERCG